LYLPKILQGGRSRSQSTIFPVGRVELEAVFRRFKLSLALLSFETLFWQPGTSKALNLEQKLNCQKLGKAPKIGFRSKLPFKYKQNHGFELPLGKPHVARTFRVLGRGLRVL
jgi:hypothetical protein